MSRAELARLSRPFDPAIWQRASELAREYRLVIEQDEDGGLIGSTVEMPLVMGDGRTLKECADEVMKATTAAIATMLEKGKRPPSPAREAKREHQLNVRLTADERLSLETAASRAGFRSISDFVRAAALDKAS